MDQIIIQDLGVYAKHGVYAAENVLGQQFLVGVVMDLDLSEAGRADDISKSIDYGEVCHFITDYMQQHTYKLIETAAEHIAEELMKRYRRVTKVRIKVKKPWAPIGLPIKTVSVQVERARHRVYLSIGSNMGDKRGYLEQAISALDEIPACQVCQVSQLIETKPYGGVEQDDFLNGALYLETTLSPQQLLEELHRIEAKAGRTREIHWGPRTLDLDILFYDNEVIHTPELRIPHVDLQNREFVLKPMNEIAPGLVHPSLHKTVAQLLEELEDAAASGDEGKA